MKDYDLEYRTVGYDCLDGPIINDVLVITNENEEYWIDNTKLDVETFIDALKKVHAGVRLNTAHKKAFAHAMSTQSMDKPTLSIGGLTMEVSINPETLEWDLIY